MSHNVGIADQQKHTNKVGMITINSLVYNPTLQSFHIKDM